MNWDSVLYADSNEKPLERLVDGYSFTSIFRTMAFVGDSLSSGEFETRDGAGNPGYFDLFDYSWGQFIARKNGLLAYNFSRGGMTTREYMETFAAERGFWDQDKACQAYVIALGVNDLCIVDMELGSLADIDPTDYRNNKPTFIGYYAAIVSRYKEISPDAKFFFVTFPDTTTPKEKEWGEPMTKAMYELAEYFGNAYVIDLYHYGPCYDERFQKAYYLYGHMNPAGYVLTAKLVDSYIDYIIRHNPDDFHTAAFINTGIPV